MRELTILEPAAVEAFLSAPTSVLVLAKRDCAACAAWTEELNGFLASDARWTDVPFGKLFLDTPGLGAFKRANPWLAEVTDLPYTVIFRNGERSRGFAGGGTERLVNRLERELSR